MSQENVDAVRGVYEEWAKGDFRAGVKLYDPLIVFETFMPDSDQIVVVQGLEQLAAFYREWFGQWRDYRATGDEFRAVGTDHVFVAGRQAATGRLSGVEVESLNFTVWTFRTGKVVRLLSHYEREAALEAAALAE